MDYIICGLKSSNYKYQRLYPLPQKSMEQYQKSGTKSGCFDVSFYEKNIADQNNRSTSNTNVAGTKFTPSTNDVHNSADNYGYSERTIENVEKSPRSPSCLVEIRLYKRRFVMLFLFAMCSMMNGFPQFQYTVVADIISCYYDVNESDVNWTCVVFMAVFLPLVFPVMILMDKKGLKVTLIIGAALNCVGSWVQCGSFSSDRFIVIMACQTIYAFGQVFVLSLPPFIAGVWFGATEVGLACAMGVFGNQLGIALGFIIPPMLMTNDCKDEVDISYELSIIAFPMAVINTIILILLICAFQEKPEVFPSIAQATKSNKSKTKYGKSLRKLFNDGPFVLLLLGYGLLTGAYFAMSTLMNEMVLIHFPGEEVDAGWLGAIMVFAGMVGSILLGTFLDKTHKYKSISVIIFVLSFLLMVGYTFLIQIVEHIWIQFVFFTLLGLIMTGYLPAGFDFGAEITYPESEAMSASLLNASTQIFSVILTNIASPLLQMYGDTFSNAFFCSCLLVGIIVMACIKCELKRCNAATECADSKPQ